MNNRIGTFPIHEPPCAIVISDVHYSLPTLELADKAMRAAITDANNLEVPLIVAGDLHDSKANLRGECINAMIETLKLCKTRPIIIIGNHDKINEKSDGHSLEFLRPYATIVDKPSSEVFPGWYLIPYFHDTEVLRNYLRTIPPKSSIIMHQGLTGADSGEYFRDKTALHPEDLAGHVVLSGHYHCRAVQPLPDDGRHLFLGNPYTLNFGEAKHPRKGHHVLWHTGDTWLENNGLRQHFIFDTTTNGHISTGAVGRDDLVLIRITGPSDELAKISKRELALEMHFAGSVRIEYIPTDRPTEVTTKEPGEEFTAGLDGLIDVLTNLEASRKVRLKGLWKDLVGDDEENR